MKKNKRPSIPYLAVLVGCLITAGCSSFVHVEPPKSQLLANLVFNEAGTVDAALAGLYSQLRDGNNGLLYGGTMGMPLYTAYASDELVNHNQSSTQFGPNFYRNSLFADSEDILSLWNTAYKQLYYANAIIEGIEGATAAVPEDKKAMAAGEALFVRAMLHFYLANLFGDVPYVATTDYQGNKSIGRIAYRDVLARIIEDLVLAEKLLGESYPTTDRVRPNQSAVRALMARVYLYREDWANAEQLAGQVIDHTALYTWVEALSGVFLKDSKETIWSFKPEYAGANSLEGSTYQQISNPVILSLNTSLIQAFEPGDARRDVWVGQFEVSGSSYHYPAKYKARYKSGTIDLEHTILLRLAEQYLIRAEARAHLGNLEGAKQDLDHVRSRAGLNGTHAGTQQALLDAILHERQVELFAEFGHRWFDLKRTGKATEVLGAAKPNWDATDVLFPIPDKELLTNPNLLPQNPGY